MIMSSRIQHVCMISAMLNCNKSDPCFSDSFLITYNVCYMKPIKPFSIKIEFLIPDVIHYMKNTYERQWTSG